MKTNFRQWGKPLLWLHLFVCCIWLYLFRTHNPNPPGWTVHIAVWSILAIQFTWGFTIGLLVGPSRARREMLKWSLLTAFLPLWFVFWLSFGLSLYIGPFIGMLYFLTFVMILTCETVCGILLGARAYAMSDQETPMKPSGDTPAGPVE